MVQIIESDGPWGLTMAEEQIVMELVKGKKYKEIAADRGVTFQTVACQIAAARVKMKVHKVSEIVRDYDRMRRPLNPKGDQAIKELIRLGYSHDVSRGWSAPCPSTKENNDD